MIIKLNLLYTAKTSKILFEQLVYCINSYFLHDISPKILKNFGNLLIMIENNKKISKAINYPDIKSNFPPKLKEILSDISG